MTINILIIDDDQKLAQLIKNYVVDFDIRATTAATPSEGLALFRAGKFDLLILDLMMPEKDGFTVCKEIRAESQIPIIMLTARGELTDRIVGLELGAEPFEPRELVARIRAITRRTDDRPTPAQLLKTASLSLNNKTRQVTLNGKTLDLTTAEYDLLYLFMRRPSETLSRDQIMENLKGAEWDVFNRTIDVSLSRLRQKLHDNPKSPEYFKTVWGTGYMFMAKVERVSSDD
jgi:DNA-binding response OmpR family regulator